MDENKIINQAIKELKNSEKFYKQFKEFSFMEELNWEDNEFQKIRFLLIRTIAFEKHTEQSIRLSSTGIEIANNYKDWFEYKKSQKQKIDYAKWVSLLVAVLSLTWNIFQGVKNNNLREENRIQGDEIEALQKENAGLQNIIDRKDKTAANSR